MALGNNKQIMQAARVLRRAVENQVKGLGFSFVEVLSPCPTIWKMQPLEAQTFVREEMATIFPLANYRDRTKEAITARRTLAVEATCRACSGCDAVGGEARRASTGTRSISGSRSRVSAARAC